MKYWFSIIGVALVVFLASYQITLRRIPTMKMTMTEKRIAGVAGGKNIMYHARRPDAAYRGVVRPSPDQLYSACIFDLGKGPVVFEGTAPENSYWSLSFFQHNTDNFFVVNDREIGGRAFRYVLVRKHQPPPKGFTPDEIIISPSKTGIVLQRVFINKEDRSAILDSQRRQSTCKMVALS
ncbi:MAG: DUF1254 domain-containing protein [Robiginitomaculum sp.]|nr:DUF1254 domain-containing protein [Robiginitomaculum sp.]